MAGFDPSYVSRLEGAKVGYTPETEEILAYMLNTTVAALHGCDEQTSAPEIAHPAHRLLPVIRYSEAIRLLHGLKFFGGDLFLDAVTTEHHVSMGSFALRIEDDMNTPQFRPGDVVLMDPGIPPRPGDFALAARAALLPREVEAAKAEGFDPMTTGVAIFGRYRVAGSGRQGEPIAELLPANPYYPSWRSDEHYLAIIAVLIEHRIPRRPG